jgi:hypothetical protein
VLLLCLHHCHQAFPSSLRHWVLINHPVVALLCAASIILLLHCCVLPDELRCAILHCMKHLIATLLCAACSIVLLCHHAPIFILSSAPMGAELIIFVPLGAHHIIITPTGTHQELEAVHDECIHASNGLQFNLFGWHNCQCNAATNSFGRRNYECRAALSFIWPAQLWMPLRDAFIWIPETIPRLLHSGKHFHGTKGLLSLPYSIHVDRGIHTIVPNAIINFTCLTWRLGKFHEEKVHSKKKTIFLKASLYKKEGRFMMAGNVHCHHCLA